MRTLSVIHAILNTTLCDSEDEMFVFHSGEKLMFLGQNVKKFFCLKSQSNNIPSSSSNSNTASCAML
jgi:hypothetical protein